MGKNKPRKGRVPGHAPGCVYEGRWKEWCIVKKLGKLKHKIAIQELERQGK